VRPFSYIRVQTVDEAIASMRSPSSRCVAGGTNVIDLMKGGVEQPSTVIDITGLPLREIAQTADGRLRIGALVPNSDLANNSVVRQQYPLLAQALLSGASGQLRNMATVGGNLLQRTRCYYFVDTAFVSCNKRKPGSGCAALEGYNRIHAILGASPQCVAVHPSDMAVALVALDATVEVQGPRGRREMRLANFHRLPGDTPSRDTNLEPDELILAVVLPASSYAANSHYLKIRDRSSYAFALVAVAVALAITEGRVADARIVLGGVAHKPWRAIAAERAILDRALDWTAAESAGEAATQGSHPLKHNQFKVELTRRAVARAIRIAGGIA
jgi:xanthine dehydrogenase YagS FAD-binding subunit